MVRLSLIISYELYIFCTFELRTYHMHNFHFRTQTNSLSFLIGMMMDGPSLEVGAEAAAVIGSHHGRVNHRGILRRLGLNHRMIGVNQQIGNQPILGQVANLASGDQQQQMMMIGQAVVRQESMMMMIGDRGLAKQEKMMMIGKALRVVIGIRRDGVGIR